MAQISVRRVAIVGAGTTGGALAAHLTNLGLSVTLIDQTVSLATTAVEHHRASMFVPERAGEIRLLGIDEATDALADADWIVEAVPDRLDVKRSVLATISRSMKPDAVVTSNSASLSIAELTEGLPEGFTSRFLVAYFSLPLSEHRLTEVRSGSDPALARDFGRFLWERVARHVVHLPDGPGGIVARYGVWCLVLAVGVAEKLRLDIEDVEAITGLGQSGGGIFGAVDRIGLDEIRDVSTNLRERLPGDRGSRFLALPNAVEQLLARGWTGDKSGRGFYRREGRERLALNLATMAYRQARVSELPGLSPGAGAPTSEWLRAALNARNEVGEYLREFLLTALRYAEYLRESMSVSVLDFDRTMEGGFGWDRGPFRLLDDLRMGAARYYNGATYWTEEGYVPTPHDEVCPSMDDCPVVDTAEGYTIHDLGDGIQALALHEGVLSPERVEGLNRLLQGQTMKRFVLTSEGRDFPALDLDFVLNALRANPLALDSYLADLQSLGERIEMSACVAAIAGRCVGPSLGLALSCAEIVAVADVTVGFEEGRLGIVPTARGTALMRGIHGESARKMSEVTVALAEGVVAVNADTARNLGFLRPVDTTEHLPERLLTTAKARAQGIVPRPLAAFAPVEVVLVGMIDRGLAERRARGGLTDHDVTVGQRLRQIVARTATYDECLDRERRETLELGSKALTQARLRHMVETGKPLRN